MVLPIARRRRLPWRSVTTWRPRILLVSNPISGGGRAARLAERIGAALAPRVALVRHVATQPAPAHTWLAPELDEIDLVAVVGGDGAVRQVAPLIAGGAVHLWHVPAGTENLFAKSLGMRAGADALRAAIDAHHGAEIDLALATPRDEPDRRDTGDVAPNDGSGIDHPFLLMASCGFDAEVVHRVAAVRRGAISHLTYAGPILSTLRSFAAPRVTVEAVDAIDAGRATGANGAIGADDFAASLVIANGPRYALGIDPVPGARLDDGLLHAVRFPGRSAAAALAWALRSRVGRAPSAWSAASFRVVTDLPMHWQLDGDAAPWGAFRTIDFRLCERRVRVLLPAPHGPDAERGSGAAALVRRGGHSIVSPSAPG